MVEEQIIRVRMPRKGELLGSIEEILGAGRFKILCKDGNLRLCRIPGKFRRKVHVKPGYIALVKPWDIEPKEKGDVVWIYNKTHTTWLKKKGFI